MPYITHKQREGILAGDSPTNAGELNYLLTITVLEYIRNKGENYQHYNDVLGALEGTKLELYRRHVAPYEVIKIEQNGDIKI